jgi:flagellar L-ring protein precursor FlgH
MNLVKRLVYFIMVALLLGMALTAVSGAESLSGPGLGIISSEKNFRKGDVITVIISESAQAQQSASTQLSKDAKVGFTTGGALNPVIPSANLGLSTSQEGEGNLSRQGKMRAMVGVMVEEVLENGNLKIKGKQSLEFDSGVQIISVEGIARPRDVSSQNEVYSYKLSNAQIQYSGEGALHEKARTGFLTRLFDLIWIF